VNHFWPKDLAQESRKTSPRKESRLLPSGDRTIPRMAGDAPAKGRHRVNAQLHVLRIAFAATAAVVIFLVVHAALEAIAQTSSVLAGA
jgi:hypothetical protein